MRTFSLSPSSISEFNAMNEILTRRPVHGNTSFHAVERSNENKMQFSLGPLTIEYISIARSTYDPSHFSPAFLLSKNFNQAVRAKRARWFTHEWMGFVATMA